MKGAKRIAAEECGGEFLFHVITPLTPYSISFDSIVLQQEKQDPFPLRSHFISDYFFCLPVLLKVFFKVSLQLYVH